MRKVRTLTPSPTDNPVALLHGLVGHGFTVNLAGGKVRVVRPASYPTWEDVPETIRPLLSELKSRQEEVADYLRQWESARTIHDQALLRLAGECPPGALTWAKGERPDLWAAVEAGYRQVTAAFEAQDFPGALAAVREFEVVNLGLFRTFTEAHQSRRLADMDPDEVEQHIMEIFNARRVTPVPERGTKAKMQQVSLLEEVV